VKSPIEGRRSPSKADQILGREHGMYADGDVQLQNIDRRRFDPYNYISEDEDDEYEVSSDEQAVDRRKAQQVKTGTAPPKGTKNWNDIPEGFLDPAPKGRKSTSRERTPKKKGEWDDWGT
jgi:palmitoyltransferase